MRTLGAHLHKSHMEKMKLIFLTSSFNLEEFHVLFMRFYKNAREQVTKSDSEEEETLDGLSKYFDPFVDPELLVAFLNQWCDQVTRRHEHFLEIIGEGREVGIHPFLIDVGMEDPDPTVKNITYVMVEKTVVRLRGIYP